LPVYARGFYIAVTHEEHHLRNFGAGKREYIQPPADPDTPPAQSGRKALSQTARREILDNRAQAAWLIKGHQYENLGGKETLFAQLEQAILGHHPISYTYQKPEGEKSYASVQPYKLVNHDGIWYLAGVDGDRL
jgi:predicted DNA-binding transcriptional regulator YafY